MRSTSCRKSHNRAALAAILSLAALSAAALCATAIPVMAQDDRGDMHAGGDHHNWGRDRGGDYAYRRGERMGYNDYSNAPVVDYRARHLRRPRHGYEWREHNGHYVMVAIATGLIASVLLGQH